MHVLSKAGAIRAEFAHPDKFHLGASGGPGIHFAEILPYLRVSCIVLGPYRVLCIFTAIQLQIVSRVYKTATYVLK